MGGSTQTTLTKPFFIGLFEVTQKQYLLVTGNNSSNFSGDKRPVEMVSFNAIHGSWGSEISSASFIGKIRTRTGLDFNLPTEVQWEYACRAGTTTTYSYGDSANGNYMWYEDNSSSQTHDVGTRQPNPWGLYDMHGNVYEWCQDYSAEGTTRRVVRGGTWRSSASYCTSSTRSGCYPDLEESYIGFRLARVLNK